MAKLRCTLIENLREFEQERGLLLQSDYTFAGDYLSWKCREGHEFQFRWRELKKLGACPECRKSERRSRDRQAVLARIESFCTQNRLELLSAYTTAADPLRWKCGRGHEFTTRWIHLQMRSQCPKCALEPAWAMQVTLDEFKVNTGIELISNYSGSYDLLQWRCGSGHEFKARWKFLRRAGQCPNCYYRRSRHSPEEAREIFAERGFILRGDYRRADLPVELEDRESGRIHTTTLKALLQGWDCRDKTEKKDYNLMQEVARKHGFRILTEEYRNVDQKLEFECPQGHRFSTVWNSWHRSISTDRRGCRICSQIETLPEREIRAFLDSRGVQYEKVRGKLRQSDQHEIDFYLPELRVGIEFCGLYWHCEKTGATLDQHQLKTIDAMEQDIELIHIWEDEWEFRRDEVLLFLNRVIGSDLPKFFDETIDVDLNRIPWRALRQQGYAIAQLLPPKIYWVRGNQRLEAPENPDQPRIGDCGRAVFKKMDRQPLVPEVDLNAMGVEWKANLPGFGPQYSIWNGERKLHIWILPLKSVNRWALEATPEHTIFIRENEIRDRWPIVLNFIQYRMGLIETKVQARLTQVVDVKYQNCEEFLRRNHFMGSSSSIAIGLMYGDRLVSVLTYKDQKGHIEIIRSATEMGTVVTGGFGKLLEHLRQRFPGRDIVSFVDCRYATGKSLEKSGFKKLSQAAGWCWTDGKDTFNRLKCTADKDRGLTERQNAQKRGWWKVYDRGQAKYILKANC